MALKASRLKFSPPSSSPASDGGSSPELGSPSKYTQDNKHTGRPMRKSAGKARPKAGFVDSSLLEDEDFAMPTSESSDEEVEDDDDVQHSGRSRKTKARPQAKRKRSPSPLSPRLDPIIYDQELDGLTDEECGGAFHRHTPKKKQLTLQFNVPLGFHGPLLVNLDTTMLNAEDDGRLHEMQCLEDKGDLGQGRSLAKRTSRAKYRGFTDLPPEMRNKIYRYLFVCSDRDLRIPASKDGQGLMRSAQFLQTCKLVHNEGCSVLYGENTFQFVRHFDTRGPFWENKPKEIGYQDVLQFLKMIGAENLQYLRDIKFTFDDALPKDTPYLHSHEKRRYLNDEYLTNCLRILRNTKLRKFLMRFIGRRIVVKTDVRFLGYLEQIKADEVDQYWDYDFHYPPQKIAELAWRDLKDQMTRKKKLYKKK